jgi:hypothetical protein
MKIILYLKMAATPSKPSTFKDILSEYFTVKDTVELSTCYFANLNRDQSNHLASLLVQKLKQNAIGYFLIRPSSKVSKDPTYKYYSLDVIVCEINKIKGTEELRLLPILLGVNDKLISIVGDNSIKYFIESEFVKIDDLFKSNLCKTKITLDLLKSYS